MGAAKRAATKVQTCRPGATHRSPDIQHVAQVARRIAQPVARRALSTPTSDVFRLVLTGGPCSGKSSSLKRIREICEGYGFAVYCVPEVPTILLLGGCTYPGAGAGQKLLAFEKALIDLQMQIEQSFIEIAASTGGKSIVIMDRGCMDIKAYLPKEAWQEVMAFSQVTEAQLIARYDAVIHLVTAAEGAEQFYKSGEVTDDSGQSVYREETPAMARTLCQKVRNGWRSHKKKVIIENTVGGFDAKLAKVESAVKAFLNIQPSA